MFCTRERNWSKQGFIIRCNLGSKSWQWCCIFTILSCMIAIRDVSAFSAPGSSSFVVHGKHCETCAIHQNSLKLEDIEKLDLVQRDWMIYNCYRFSSSSRLALQMSMQDNDDDVNNDSKLQQENDGKSLSQVLDEKLDDLADNLNAFLDKPVFDLDLDDSNDSNGPMKWFSNLVQSDYYLAEAIYSTVFFSIMVVVSQELMRKVLYGDHYVPFTRGGDGLW